MSDSTVSFASPPVVEVVVGVAFDGFSGDTGALLASFWKERLRHHFPLLQQQPPYSPHDEQFAPGARSVTLNLTAGLPVTRLWAQSSDGQELLQLQPGWFACNWRRVQPDGEYDRWQRRREAFRKYFNELSGYLVTEGAGEPKVRQCEVTYINHIFPSAVWSHHGEYSKIFNLSSVPTLTSPLEQVTFQAQFMLVDDTEPYGRLYAKVLPAFGPDGNTPLYVFELTARGAPKGDGTEGALKFLDSGRKAVDDMFVALTTNAMHDEWGIQS
jgi:uncharacterized protein (TIGR04255 family)